MAFEPEALATWSIVALATGGVIVRPWRLPEAVWAVAGAAALVLSGLLPWRSAIEGVMRGDVYLFLIGMMLLSELGRGAGLFDWLAAVAVEHSRGSAQRLFMLVYAVGTIDATAVVLTPAVNAATRVAGAEPLPYLFICAFVANAASFVLPISNPANLVIYGSQMAPLMRWLAEFAWPSVMSISITCLVLRLTQRRVLAAEKPARSRGRG